MCIAYFDDMLVFSKTFDEQVVGVETILPCLRNRGVKLNPGKCELFKKGRVIFGKTDLWKWL